MRRLIALLLSIMLIVSGCANKTTSDNIQPSDSASPTISVEQLTPTESAIISPTGVIELPSMNDEMVSFSRMDDPEYMAFVQDMLYAGLSEQFGSDDYYIESIKVAYLSREYLEELAYNSQSNIWFGYTLKDIKEVFGDTPYVFTLGEDNTTVVVPFQSYDDTYNRVIKNVVFGTGVILVCATVSFVTGGVGLTPVSMIFSASAKTGTSMGLSWGALSGLIAGAVEGIKTKNFDKATKAAALAGSNSFKWGAIVGAVVGGVGEAIKVHETPGVADAAEVASATPRGAELRALKNYGGEEQVSFLAGERVAMGTPGATRPDVVRVVGDHLEAIEVKFYNLKSSASLGTLKNELTRQVTDRIANLPKGSTQRIVLDVTGKGYDKSLVEGIKGLVSSWLDPIYPGIPIDIMGL